ncbi:MAG: hypothetical protein WD751_11895 [Anaerolineales bacterium]
MTNNGNVILVICLTALIGLGVPAMLYAGLRRRGTIGQIELMRRAGKQARQPWQQEDASLEELSKRVENLRKKAGAPKD